MKGKKSGDAGWVLEKLEEGKGHQGSHTACLVGSIQQGTERGLTGHVPTAWVVRPVLYSGLSLLGLLCLKAAVENNRAKRIN